MRQTRKLVVLALAALAGSAGHEAFAAVCFPYAGGVPGEGGSGPPDWWSSGAAPTGTKTSSFLDDPRWRGSLSDMVMSNERFRVLVENTGGVQYLVMSGYLHGEATATTGGGAISCTLGVWDDASAVRKRLPADLQRRDLDRARGRQLELQPRRHPLSRAGSSRARARSAR